MRKKINIYILILLLFSIFFFGCKGKEEKKSEDKSQEMPPLLEQVQEMTDDVVKAAISKDWSKSLDKVKNLQNKWNDLYPNLKKQGVPQDDVDNFVKDLNVLIDYLITKTMNLPKSSSGGEQKSDTGQQQTEQQPPEQEKQQQQAQGGGKEGQGGTQESSDSQGSQKSSPMEEKKPEEILKEIDPIIKDSQEDLTIINASIEITKYMPKFMQLFKSNVPPDLFKLKYYIRHLDVASKMIKWDVAAMDMENISQTWDSVLPTAIQIDPDMKVQLDQSIKELKDVVASKNSNLTGIKTKVIMDDLEGLVKSIKQKAEEEKKKKK